MVASKPPKGIAGKLKWLFQMLVQDPKQLAYISAKLSETGLRKVVALPNHLHHGEAFRTNKSNFKIAHVGYHFPGGNAGDTLLFDAIRVFFDTQLKEEVYWSFLPVKAQVTAKTIEAINKQDALIIGGGGLFLKDTNPNQVSGWQWAISLDLLKQIKVPIFVFSVGYNRFRGQADFDPIFTESLKLLVEKSTFFGLRNFGSINAIKSYLPESIHSKIGFQPCITTVLSQYYGNYHKLKPKTKTIGLNLALDRVPLRFGAKKDEILEDLVQALKLLQKKGWTVRFISHCYVDNEAVTWLNERGLNHEFIDITRFTATEVMEAYAKVDIAIGMRGHSQMIPFGLDKAIFSLISHEKVKYFLLDMGHPEWGADLQEPNIKERLLTFVEKFEENPAQHKTELESAQSVLWEQSLENFELMEKALIKAKQNRQEGV